MNLPPWALSPKLDVDVLGLVGRDLEIARAIRDATEAARQAEIEQLPPLTEQEASEIISGEGGGLLAFPRTRGELQREAADARPWDAYLRAGPATTSAAARLGMNPLEVLHFALVNCDPTNWDALFWHLQWAKEVSSTQLGGVDFSQHVRMREAEAARKVAQDEAARRKSVAAKGGAAKGKKREPAREYVIERWLAERREWRSKAEFADKIAPVVFELHQVRVQPSTIEDEWLGPARLAEYFRKKNGHS